MTAVDIVVIVAGLLFGYRLVSNYLSPTVSQGDGQKQAEHAAPPKPMWFEVLGVVETAGKAEIEHAYRVMISQYHPDKVAQLGEDIRRMAEAKSKEINAAYDAAMRLRGH